MIRRRNRGVPFPIGVAFRHRDEESAMPRPPIRFTPSFFLPAAAGAGGGAWQPATDVYRTRDGWLVKFDLAGVRPEDIHVTVSGRELTVVGVRRDFCLDEGCYHYTMEITYSRFER